MASRGCPFNCIFCTKSVWGNTIRFRSPEKIANEIEFLHNRFGINEIFFHDDTMNLKREWFLSICGELMKRGLNQAMAFKAPFRADEKLIDPELLEAAKKAGFCMIIYGVESGNQAVLDNIKKGITIPEIKRAFELTHKAGINTYASFMVGNIGDTRETVMDSIKLAREINPSAIGFSVATPRPGSEFYRIAVARGWMDDSSFNDRVFAPLKRNETLIAQEIEELAAFAIMEVKDIISKQEYI